MGCKVTEMKQGEMSDHLSFVIMKSSELPEGVVIVQGQLNSISSISPSERKITLIVIYCCQHLGMHPLVRFQRRGKCGESSPNI